MGARELMGAGVTILAVGTQTIASAATTAFDFGTPNDIYLPTCPGAATRAKKSGDRLLLVCTAVIASGTTSSLAWVVQDADDVDGGTTIGTPATALTDTSGSAVLTATVGTQQRIVGIRVQSGRPWLRVSVTHAGGGSDSYACTAVLLGIPTGL